MSRWNLRNKPRNISYYEPEEPPLDEYVYCDHCADIVYEYCAIHGPLLVVPDDKVPANVDFPSYIPRAALTIPHIFLHLAPSVIPGAGLGVFSTLTLPSGVRFGPYRGKIVDTARSDYCWQIYNKDRKPSHLVEADDANKSNWMRYVNCARHWCEQNLVAYQYQGQIYYRTIRIIPKFTELLVFYGSEFANYLHIDIRLFNSPLGQEKLYYAFIKNQIPKTAEENTTIQSTKHIGELIIPPSDKTAEAETNIAKQPESSNNVDEINAENGHNRKTIDLKNNSMLDKEKILTTNLKPKLKSQLPVHSGEKPYSCDICQKRFSHKSSLKTHLRIHSGEKPYACDICQKRFNQAITLKTHLRIHSGEKPYACDICQQGFNEASSLKTHLRIHSGEKPYACDICQQRFNEASSLKRHLRIHSGEKPYACDICQKRFNQASNIKSHLRIHSGEKPYACDICQKRFNLAIHLKTHLRIHSGEKPYACDICQQRFNEASSLKRHLRIHSGEKPYACDICQKRFNQASNIKSHLRIHSGEKPYACDICQQRFSQAISLKTHLRIHSGEKPYACDICQKLFNRADSLKTHLRIHSGEKPYACDICHCKFTHRQNLKNHLSIHL